MLRSAVVYKDITEDLKETVAEKRHELLEALADIDDTVAEYFLNDTAVPQEVLVEAIRRNTMSCKFSPVFMGSAIKNTAVQPLLDGVCTYLPDPNEKPVVAFDSATSTLAPEEVQLVPASNAPLVALAFKLEENKFGQLTYIRVYQGTLRKGAFIVHARTGKKVKVPRLVRMHSNELEDVNEIGSGEICAIFGVDCATGDTFTDGSTTCTMVRIKIYVYGFLTRQPRPRCLSPTPSSL